MDAKRMAQKIVRGVGVLGLCACLVPGVVQAEPVKDSLAGEKVDYITYRLTQALSLSGEQAEQVREILAAAAEEFRQDLDAVQAQRRAFVDAVRARRQATVEAIAGILTNEQQVQFAQLQEQRRERIRRYFQRSAGGLRAGW